MIYFGKPPLGSCNLLGGCFQLGRLLTQWCRDLGLNPKTVNSRIHMGWEPVDAFTKPIHHEFASKGKEKA